MYSIGLMSGTSMDGIDVALLETDGETFIRDIEHIALSYDRPFKIMLKAAEFAVHRYKGDLAKAENNYHSSLFTYLTQAFNLSPDEITLLNAELLAYFKTSSLPHLSDIIHYSTLLHAKAVNTLLLKTNLSPKQIDVIGYHGQTLLHSPHTATSVIVGNGQLLADSTGILVINNFRQRDMELGGQGAPFAPLYHQALAIQANIFPLAVVNCGGIANVTFITGKNAIDVIGFDTGPGNALIDRYIQHRTQGKELMDEDGHYGKTGQVNESTLALLFEKAIIKPDFLTTLPLKSLDINDLQLSAELLNQLNTLTLPDACATLEDFTAETIISSLSLVNCQPKHWILAGGGWKNPVILEKLISKLHSQLGEKIKIETADEAGWNSQAMEAQIFAYFAVRSLKNLPLSVPTTTGVQMATSGGHAFLPNHGEITDAAKKLLMKNPSVLN